MAYSLAFVLCSSASVEECHRCVLACDLGAGGAGLECPVGPSTVPLARVAMVIAPAHSPLSTRHSSVYRIPTANEASTVIQASVRWTVPSLDLV